jgi:Tol biopolymer transport system component
MKKLAFGTVCALFLAALVDGCGSDGGGDVHGPQTTGSIRVATSTSGDTLDPDGYAVTVDGARSNVGLNDVATFPGLRVGSHSVELSGVAKNCTVSGQNPRTSSVTVGHTTEERFDVTCAVALFDHIAFVSERDGNGEVYVMDADGSNPTNLTNNAAWDVYPAWSPDGTRIAFVSDRDGSYEIYVMDADGSNPRNLTNNAVWDGDPAWSPDGMQIAFVTGRDGNDEIYVMNADGSNPRNLTNSAAGDDEFAWSPDGAHMAFVTGRDGNDEIYIMDADGSNPTNLSNHLTWDLYPVWSPDGTQIAFRSTRDGAGDVYVVDADGSNLTNLTDNTALDYSPAWSPMRFRDSLGPDLNQRPQWLKQPSPGCCQPAKPASFITTGCPIPHTSGRRCQLFPVSSG